MDWMEQAEAERLKQIAEDEAKASTPEAIAAREAKKKAEHEKGVRLGWWDEDGNSLIPETDDEDETDEEEEG